MFTVQPNKKLEELYALDKRIAEQRNAWNDRQSELNQQIASLKDQLHECLLREGKGEASNYNEVERQLKIAEAQLKELKRQMAAAEPEWQELELELLQAAEKEAQSFIDNECAKEHERIVQELLHLKVQYNELLKELGRVYGVAWMKHEEREDILMRKDPGRERQRGGSYTRFELRPSSEYFITGMEVYGSDKPFYDGYREARGLNG
ncbi:hypothetical protein [Aneurinibacillus danicus]|uniref:Uncharacterized protein n=1 Tax=Aneurinibacillus danicus TaxID=267746 RepID=A0A511V8H5_9BACL|nr:hypothetical protein [Aneurinibacillus danicus]GEN35099.1 hypothetical protein ADA01nite_25590 [Aneurinibacillus danicus]